MPDALLVTVLSELPLKIFLGNTQKEHMGSDSIPLYVSDLRDLAKLSDNVEKFRTVCWGNPETNSAVF